MMRAVAMGDRRRIRPDPFLEISPRVRPPFPGGRALQPIARGGALPETELLRWLRTVRTSRSRQRYPAYSRRNDSADAGDRKTSATASASNAARYRTGRPVASEAI
jgi:hypothetical protein